MLYGKYLEQLSSSITDALDDLIYSYNFDVGVEFEIAIAELLQRVLPDKYGVCRGFVVAQDGTEAGDDIVIYDQHSFPTLRGKTSLARKQRIPAEAVYAYIEVKNSLDKKTFAKACSQIKTVRTTIEKREELHIQKALHSRVTLPFGNPKSPLFWPPHLNRPYTSIWSRNTEGLSEATDKWAYSRDQINEFQEGLDIKFLDSIYVLGSHLSIPAVLNPDDSFIITSPFSIDDNSLTPMLSEHIDVRAIVHLMWAIDSMKLGHISWGNVLMS